MRILRELLPVALACCALPAPAQVQRIASPRAGLIETGAPMFTITSRDTIGLESPPTDLHLMPDGRVLVVAAQQLALGDGIRWEVFRQAREDDVARALTVAVDDDGSIYQAIPGGFARVVFGEDGFWRLEPVAKWPENETTDRPVPRHVIAVGDEWFWHSASGTIISWRPGRPALARGKANDVEQIFHFDGRYFLCDRSDGRVRALDGGEAGGLFRNVSFSEDSLVTCATAFDGRVLLVGTAAEGVRLTDGRFNRPIGAEGLLAGGSRINDVCQAGDGYFAAAIENHGVVFFDRNGRTSQTLDRSIDQRIARASRLRPGPGGVLWGLVGDGIFRVAFPSRVSHFEPLVPTGLTTAHPNRLDGRLWLMSDRQILRATYDANGRLDGWESDSPPGQIVFMLSCAPGLPIASTENGAFCRTEAGWQLFAPGTRNMRVLQPEAIDGQWLYGGIDEVGWIRWDAGRLALTRSPLAGLGNVYTTLTDGQGDIWLERGTGLLGRVHPGRPALGPPVVELFDESDGVPRGWAQVFVVDGVARFNIADRILRFDEGSRRFVDDAGFARQFAGLGTIVGRPGRDARGRLWLTTEQGIHIFEGPLGQLKPVPEKMPPGFQPVFFTFESGGAVWMHGEHRFARYDPSMPAARPAPLRALITHLTLLASRRTLFAVDREPPPFGFSDNSVVAHFAAPGDPFAASVSFEVMLEGAGREWVSAGSGGSAVFNRLKEGRYVLHVRPRSGTAVGRESSLAFAILPPWYRTNAAYAAYVFSALGIILSAAWLSSYVGRRENARLERVVAQRTRELNDSNTRLAGQVEEIRMLSQAVDQSPIAILITRPDGTIIFANPRMHELAGRGPGTLVGAGSAGIRATAESADAYAELDATIARGEPWQGQLATLRPDGRIVQVRASASPIRGSDGQVRSVLLLLEDITEWLDDQERHRKLEAQLAQSRKLESLGTLAGGIAHDFNNILTGILGYSELARLATGPGHPIESDLAAIRAAGLRAKELVAQILTFSRRGRSTLVTVDLANTVGEAVKLVRATTPTTIDIRTRLEPGLVRADATQVHQIIINLCTNAVHALRDRPGRIDIGVKRIEVGERLAGEIAGLAPGSCMLLTVADDGHGMDADTLARVFDPFFTTKKPGEGTGLGLAIVQGIAVAHGAALRALSAPGQGTTFELYFPVSRDASATPPPPAEVPLGRGEELVVVDDEPSVANFAATRLRQMGYRPAVFYDPLTALAAITAAPTRFRALVTDLTMPGLTGIDLVRRLREQGVAIPVVIVSGYGRELTTSKLEAMPDTVALQKPFEGEDLARALARVIAGRAKPA